MKDKTSMSLSDRFNGKQGRYERENHITKRNLEFIDLLLQGMTNDEIAKELCVTTKAVKWQFTEIYKKLQVRSRFELMAIAIRLMNGYVTAAEIVEKRKQEINSARTLPLGRWD